MSSFLVLCIKTVKMKKLLLHVIYTLTLFLLIHSVKSLASINPFQPIHIPESNIESKKSGEWFDQTLAYEIFNVNTDLLINFMATISESTPVSISIPVPAGNTLQIDFTELDQVGGSSIWTGNVAGAPLSNASITVVGNAVIGHIHDGVRSFVLEPYSNSYTMIREVSLSLQVAASFDNYGDRIATRQSDRLDRIDISHTHILGISDDTEFRLLSVYTDDARIAQGGEAVIEAKINLAISGFNTALEKAGVTQRLVLAAHRSVRNQERILEKTKNWDRILHTDEHQPILQERDIRDWRDETQADIVMFLVTERGGRYSRLHCAAGNIMDRFQSLTKIKGTAAFILSTLCLPPQISFTHEIGHLLGLAHSPNERVGYNSAYGGDFHSTNISTVMSSNPMICYLNPRSFSYCGRRVNFFSSSTDSLYGEPLGNPVSDSARVIRETTPIIASLYERLPTITQHPVSIRLKMNMPIRLEVQASGVGQLTYQWFKDDEKIEATESVYAIDEASLTDGGRYSVRVSNEHGYTDSYVANVFGIVVTTQPEEKRVKYGRPFKLKVLAQGSETLRYQWFKNEQPIEGATHRIYEIRSANIDHEGKYFVQVSDSDTSINSETVHVNVTHLPPVIVSQSSDEELKIGSTTFLYAFLESYEPTYHYRWLKDGVVVGRNGRNHFLTLTVDENSSGVYQLEITERFNNNIILSEPIQVSIMKE